MNEKLLNLICELPGWTSYHQIIIISKLIEKYSLNYIVEIGIFGGRTFLPFAILVSYRNGLVVGIDPYSPRPQTEEFYKDYSHFDFQILKIRLQTFIERYRLKNATKLIDKDFTFVAKRLPVGIELLHISGHYGREGAFDLARKYVRKVRIGGFIWLEEFEEIDVELLMKEAKIDYVILGKIGKKDFIMERR